MQLETIGDRIKKLRTMKAMTQEDLGEILGVKKAAIQKYENGSIVNLKLETIEKIAKLFRVSPSYIMGWDDFDYEKNANMINRELIATEELQKVFGNEGLRIISVMYTLNDEGMEKLMNYANDIFMIDYYVDVEKRDRLLKDNPPTKATLKYRSQIEIDIFNENNS